MRKLIIMLQGPYSDKPLLTILNTPEGIAFLKKASLMLDLDEVRFGRAIPLTNANINEGISHALHCNGIN